MKRGYKGNPNKQIESVYRKHGFRKVSSEEFYSSDEPNVYAHVEGRKLLFKMIDIDHSQSLIQTRAVAGMDGKSSEVNQNYVDIYAEDLKDPGSEWPAMIFWVCEDSQNFEGEHIVVDGVHRFFGCEKNGYDHVDGYYVSRSSYPNQKMMAPSFNSVLNGNGVDYDVRIEQAAVDYIQTEEAYEAVGKSCPIFIKDWAKQRHVTPTQLQRKIDEMRVRIFLTENEVDIARIRNATRGGDGKGSFQAIAKVLKKDEEAALEIGQIASKNNCSVGRVEEIVRDWDSCKTADSRMKALEKQRSDCHRLSKDGLLKVRSTDEINKDKSKQDNKNDIPPPVLKKSPEQRAVDNIIQFGAIVPRLNLQRMKEMTSDPLFVERLEVLAPHIQIWLQYAKNNG